MTTGVTAGARASLHLGKLFTKLHEICAAHELMESSSFFGKIVLTTA